MKFHHMCVDVETLSTRPDSVIVQIAGVKFNMENDKTEDFLINVCPRQGKELGMRISQDTLDWWKEQRPDVVKSWQHSAVKLPHALDAFLDFVGPDGYKMKFYANGIQFDFPILEWAFAVTEKKEPWKYWNLMDMRTIYQMVNFNTKDGKRIGEYHNALDDCKTQIWWMKNIMAGNAHLNYKE